MKEDIERISNLIEYIENADYVDASQCFDGEDIQAIKNLLTRYKEMEAENKKFYEGEMFSAKQLKNIEQNQKKYFINKQVVKEKIEEWDKERYIAGEHLVVEVLQELLREE